MAGSGYGLYTAVNVTRLKSRFTDPTPTGSTTPGLLSRGKMTKGKLFVGWRMAGLYAEGTVIEDRHGQQWFSWRPDTYPEYDMAPEWRRVVQ